ncbi:MAG: prolipoprotein diacylglyceryl transferase [Phycisphaerales bacterium]|jgi:phosphatidylglycerol:prolipoprotein diacylglycerol transferase|nr:prolipoprotein diacylglyceryl transferase [Phycisphaerales bacterium]
MIARTLDAIALPATPTLGAWLHDVSPYVWRISGDFGVRWYGMAYVVGFLLAYLMLRWLASRGATLIPAHRAADVIIAGAFGAVIGGRVGYILIYQPSLLIGFSSALPFWDALAINKGGLASHGGMIGLAVVAWLSARSITRENMARGLPRVPVLGVTDAYAIAAPAGILLGRIANFINGELLGRIVAAPGEHAPWWAVRFPQEIATRHAPELTPDQAAHLAALLEASAPGASFRVQFDAMMSRLWAGSPELAAQLATLVSARHPSQIYQGLAEGVVLGIALLVIARRAARPGLLSGSFLIIYGVLRVLTEVWRLPDDHLAVQRILGLSRGQWLSVAMVISGVLVLAWKGRRTLPVVPGWGRKGSRNATSPADA